ncbi:hypothetical protein O2U05_04845 [Ligilactobacillus salivarius]|uniref:glycan biosynthesis hexose transferase WsfD n=1 Tax=Ligilactobacillus salivarius TaxID=1624 RepID=UPI0024BA81CB|nr:hypothetical protein [Ligilactobacillus salivarius]WHS06813.1 hypothetical protein O2U07_05915 [Ligilactobacillus salivarius]WHS08783.1 hypothetical protein O2U05_04845 [Ligilactobacillus salivarius]WNB33690.1 hypothetical protein O2U09_07230 [Ligilactobacillus salivarius]
MIEKFRKNISPPLLACVLAAVIVGYLLFVSPINGYADNGDFARVIYINGIYPLDTKNYQYTTYLTQHYGLFKYYNEHIAMLFSSQGIFVKTAVLLNKLFYSKTVFDIRFMGLVYYVFYLGAIYLLTLAVTNSNKRKNVDYVIALIVVFMFADSSLTLYFNSFFAEPVMIIAMIYITASLLLLMKKHFTRSWYMLAVYFLASLALVTVKQQNAPLALSLVVVTIGIYFVYRNKLSRLLIPISCLILLGSGIATYVMITDQFSNINSYQSMTRGVMLKEQDPGNSLEKGGISRQYGLLKGDIYTQTYAATSIKSKNITKDFIPKYNFAWILKYYLTHEQQFNEMLDVAARDGYLVQIKAVGDFTKKSGAKPHQQVQYFTLYGAMMKAFFPKKFAFYMTLCVVLVALYIVIFVISVKSNEMESAIKVFMVIGYTTMVIGTFITAVVGDGDADLAKHLLVLFKILWILNIGSIGFFTFYVKKIKKNSIITTILSS